MKPIVLSVDEIVARLVSIALGHIGDLITVDKKGGWRVDPGKVVRSRIGKRMRETAHGPDVEVCDQLRALELLGRYHGMWKGQSEEDGSLLEAIAIAERIAQDRKAARLAEEQQRQLPGPSSNGFFDALAESERIQRERNGGV
jgi:hypothetical protein